MSETAIEPSPTALATRLIERARTSPATKTPGTLVSSRNGSRFSGQPSPLHVGAGEDEAVLVARDDALEPVGVRRGADEDEAGVDVERRTRRRRRPATRSRRSRPSSPVAAIAELPRAHLDVGQRRELLDEVVRHRRLQRRAAHEHRHLARVAAEVHGGLAGRVRAADDDDVLLRRTSAPRSSPRRSRRRRRSARRSPARSSGGRRRPTRSARSWRSARRRR